MKMIEKVEDIYNDDNYIGYYYVEDRHKMELEDMRLTGIDEGMEIGKKYGINEGIEKGIEKGKKKKEIELASKMLKEKIPIETISNITGLSLSKLKTL